MSKFKCLDCGAEVSGSEVSKHKCPVPQVEVYAGDLISFRDPWGGYHAGHIIKVTGTALFITKGLCIGWSMPIKVERLNGMSKPFTEKDLIKIFNVKNPDVKVITRKDWRM